MAVDTATARSFIAKGEVEQAIKVVVASIQSLPDHQNKNEVLHLAARYRENAKRKLQGLIDEREFQLIHNQALMELIGLLDALDGKIAETYSPGSKQKEAFLANLKISRGSRYIGCTLALSLLLCFGVALYHFNSSAQPQPKFLAAKTMPGERLELLLPDSSTVFLNEETSLSYPAEIAADYTVKMKGEAYFVIRSNSERTFNIKTGDIHLTVLGTEFNLRAYPDEPFIEVEVAAGLVRMTATPEQGPVIRIEAGTRGVYNTESKQIRLKENTSLNAPSWKTRRLVFSDAPLSEVAEVLERDFKVQVKFKEKELADCHFTGEFQERSLKDILQTLEFTLFIEIIQEGDTIYFSGQGCK